MHLEQVYSASGSAFQVNCPEFNNNKRDQYTVNRINFADTFPRISDDRDHFCEYLLSQIQNIFVTFNTEFWRFQRYTEIAQSRTWGIFIRDTVYSIVLQGYTSLLHAP